MSLINKLTDQQLKELASQLGCPDDEKGKEVADMMHESNIIMTQEAISSLNITANDRILEPGHASCGHLPYLLSQAENLHFTGLEISPLMHKQASETFESLTAKNIAEFHLYDGRNIPFPENSFSKIFTVNTIYFWENPSDLFGEFYRVLQPGGLFSIAYVQKQTMEKLPFTKYGFEYYDETTIRNLAEPAGLKFSNISQHSDLVKSKSGETLNRNFDVITFTKP